MEIKSPHFRGKLTLFYISNIYIYIFGYISNIEMLSHDTPKSAQTLKVD